MSSSNLKPYEIQDLIERYQSELRKMDYQRARVEEALSELQKQTGGSKSNGRAGSSEASSSSSSNRSTSKSSTSKPTTNKSGSNKSGSSASSGGEQPATKRRRGRPAGSKNKPKSDSGSSSSNKSSSKTSSSNRNTSSSKSNDSESKERRSPIKDKSSGSARGRRQRSLSDWDSAIIDSIDNAGKVQTSAELYDVLKNMRDREKIDWDDDKVRAKLNAVLHKLANKRGDLIKVKYSGKGYAYGLSNWSSGPNSVKKKYQR